MDAAVAIVGLVESATGDLDAVVVGLDPMDSMRACSSSAGRTGWASLIDLVSAPRRGRAAEVAL